MYHVGGRRLALGCLDRRHLGLISFNVVHTMIRFLLSTLAICIGLTGVFGLANLAWLAPDGFLHVDGVAQFGRPLLMATSLLCGIYFKAIYDELQSTNTEYVRIVLVMKRSFRSRRFWAALMVSPIVLLSFLPSVDAITSNVLLALVCFENGFFFRSIFEKRAQVQTHAQAKNG